MNWKYGIAALAAGVVIAQVPPATRTQGPGVQANADARYAETIKGCKVAPPVQAGRGPAPKGGAPKGPAAPAAPREVTIAAIAGVVAGGGQWKDTWTVDGNNADGFAAAKNGDLLIAQNDNSNVVRLTPDGKTSNEFTGTNTGGSLAFNSKGGLFIVNRGLNPSIEQLLPTRRVHASEINGDPLHCIGPVLNDSTADKKGGVYFTAGFVFYADAKGKVTKYGENLGTNGIALSADEKRLWVTNGPTLAVFDVQKDGSLANQREFVRWEGGGGDGLTLDTKGRIYVTMPLGVQVISPEGKVLGLIPTNRAPITATFGGKDRKTLYAITRDNALNRDWVIALPMLAQGLKERGK